MAIYFRAVIVAIGLAGTIGCSKGEIDTYDTATIDTQGDGLDADRDGVSEADVD
jgi:hypothetical protein